MVNIPLLSRHLLSQEVGLQREKYDRLGHTVDYSVIGINDRFSLVPPASIAVQSPKVEDFRQGRI